MAKKNSLDNLVEGLAGTVVEAQRRIEIHQINNFLSFFDKNKQPKKNVQLSIRYSVRHLN